MEIDIYGLVLVNMKKNHNRVFILIKSNEIRCVAGIVYVIFIFAALISMFLDFQPTFVLSGIPTISAFVLAVGMFLIFLLIRIFNYSIIGVFFSAFICLGFSFAVVSKTLPAVHHFFTNKEGEIRLTVIKKHSNYSRGRCSPRVVFKEITAPLFKSVCVEQQVFAKLSKGQVICLTAKISPVGVSGIGNFKEFRKCGIKEVTH